MKSRHDFSEAGAVPKVTRRSPDSKRPPNNSAGSITLPTPLLLIVVVPWPFALVYRPFLLRRTQDELDKLVVKQRSAVDFIQQNKVRPRAQIPCRCRLRKDF